MNCKTVNPIFALAAASTAVFVASSFLIKSTIPGDAQDVKLVETGPQGHYAFQYKNGQGQTCLKNNPFFDICG